MRRAPRRTWSENSGEVSLVMAHPLLDHTPMERSSIALVMVPARHPHRRRTAPRARRRTTTPVRADEGPWQPRCAAPRRGAIGRWARGDGARSRDPTCAGSRRRSKSAREQGGDRSRVQARPSGAIGSKSREARRIDRRRASPRNVSARPKNLADRSPDAHLATQLSSMIQGR